MFPLLKSYGAMTEVMRFLSPIEVICLQLANRWMYSRGVGRVQTRITLANNMPIFFFTARLLSPVRVFQYEPKSRRCSSWEDQSLGMSPFCVPLQVGDGVVFVYNCMFKTWHSLTYTGGTGFKRRLMAAPAHRHRNAALVCVRERAIYMTGRQVDSSGT